MAEVLGEQPRLNGPRVVIVTNAGDDLLKQQWTRLLEIQEIQLELMKELVERKAR